MPHPLLKKSTKLQTSSTFTYSKFKTPAGAFVSGFLNSNSYLSCNSLRETITSPNGRLILLAVFTILNLIGKFLSPLQSSDPLICFAGNDGFVVSSSEGLVKTLTNCV